MQNKIYLKGALEDMVSENFRNLTHAALFDPELPIFDEDGLLSKEKIESWDSNEMFHELGIIASALIEKESSAVLLGAFNKFSELVKFCNISIINKSEKHEGKTIGSPILTSSVHNNYGIFRSTMTVYNEFLDATEVIVAPGLHGVKQGISLAYQSVIHSLGHILYLKLISISDFKALGDFNEQAGWTKGMMNGNKGKFLNYTSAMAWRKVNGSKSVSQLGNHNPSDEFAEAVCLYLLNGDYLYYSNQKMYNAIANIFDKYSLEVE